MANRSPFPLEGGYMPCFHRGSHQRELNPPPTPVVAKKATRGLHCGSSRAATFSLSHTISTKRTRKLFEKLFSDVAHLEHRLFHDVDALPDSPQSPMTPLSSRLSPWYPPAVRSAFS